MQVKYVDLPSQYEDQEVLGQLAEFFKSCKFVLGPEEKRFAEEFATLCRVRHAIGLNSGTDALWLGLLALGVGAGDEVITVSNSFIATTGAIVAVGARPVFIDVGPDYNMDPDLIEGVITPQTKAVLPVHLTGNPADMPRINAVAERHGLFVIEDAAQSVGASLNGKRCGSFGHCSAFSLHPLKNLNAAGDAGALTTDDDELFETVRRLRNHGLKNRDQIDFFGYNSRLDDIQALIVSLNLRRLDEVTAKRVQNAALYDQLLAGMGEDLVIPPRRPEANQVFHTYVVQVRDRERLVEALDAKGIGTKIHYPIPIHLQAPCRQWGYGPGSLPVTESQATRILSLPVHQHLTEQQIRYVADCIRDFYRA